MTKYKYVRQFMGLWNLKLGDHHLCLLRPKKLPLLRWMKERLLDLDTNATDPTTWKEKPKESMESMLHASFLMLKEGNVSFIQKSKQDTNAKPVRYHYV